VASLVIAYFGLFQTVDSVATEAAPPQPFRSGETATLRLTPEDKPVLYASTTAQVRFTCEATTASGGKVALTRPGYKVNFTAGGRIWEYIFDIGVTRPDTYRITCEAPPSSDIVFGVGRQFGGEQVAETAGGILLYVGLVFLAFVVAVVVSVLVPVLRARNRRRLAGTLPPHPPRGR